MQDPNDVQQKTNQPNRRIVRLPKIFDFNFEDPVIPMPWRSSSEDITDYFNYGFNEETWRVYSEKVKEFYSKNPIEKKVTNNSLLIDKNLPLEIGGFGDPMGESLKSMEVFQNFTENNETFWLDMDMESEKPFWPGFNTFLDNNTNNPTNIYQNQAFNGNSLNVNFKKYQNCLTETMKNNEIDFTAILNKTIHKNSKEKVGGFQNKGMVPNKPGERSDVGFRQMNYSYGNSGKMNISSLGTRETNPIENNKIERSKFVKQE